MEVLFTNPPFVVEVNGVMRYGCGAGSRWPWSQVGSLCHYSPFPFFMAYAVAILRQEGIDAGMYDSVVIRETNYESYYQHIKELNPQIIVIETSTPTIQTNLQVAEKLSQIIPSVEIALSGPHATVFAESLIELPYITYILKGEYELNSVKMWKTRQSGIYESEMIEDIDSCPYPYRDPAVFNNYWDPSMVQAKPQLQIYASRGCPFSCTFCMWTAVMYQGKYRARTPEKVIEEIRYCINTFGSKSIFFDDDTWNIGNDRISLLCDGLKEIGLPWSMMGRTDTSPLWLFDKMIECGCEGLRFGVETFQERVQKKICKKLNVNETIKILAYLSDKYPHVRMHLMTMKNLPTESDTDREYNLKIAHDLGFTIDSMIRKYQCSACIPFPGTALYDELLQLGHGDIINNFALHDGALDGDNILSQLVKNMKI